MSGTRSHDALVGSQFGPQAGAYLQSAVHAGGADLAALVEVARQRLPAGGSVLDLGCGGGHVTYAMAPHAGEVTAYDLSADMLQVVARTAAERALGNVTTRQGRAERLPFEDAAFDLVVSRYSAHHWGDAAAGLREAARVLRPGGALVVVDAVSPGTPLLDTFLQAVEILRDASHVRDYSRGEWEAMLAAAGLMPREVRHFRVRLDFASWVARMRTPESQIAAIAALQDAVSAGVRQHFAIEPDRSFRLDVALFAAEKPAPGA